MSAILLAMAQNEMKGEKIFFVCPSLCPCVESEAKYAHGEKGSSMESGYRDAVFVEMERGSNLKSRLSEEDTIHTSRPACRREDNPEKKKKD